MRLEAIYQAEKHMRGNEMTEYERVVNSINKCIESIQKEGCQSEAGSLCIISQTLVLICQELAIMNDRSKR